MHPRILSALINETNHSDVGMTHAALVIPKGGERYYQEKGVHD